MFQVHNPIKMVLQRTLPSFRFNGSAILDMSEADWGLQYEGTTKDCCKLCKYCCKMLPVICRYFDTLHADWQVREVFSTAVSTY